jgi:hypothetical protein
MHPISLALLCLTLALACDATDKAQKSVTTGAPPTHSLTHSLTHHLTPYYCLIAVIVPMPLTHSLTAYMCRCAAAFAGKHPRGRRRQPGHTQQLLLQGHAHLAGVGDVLRVSE